MTSSDECVSSNYDEGRSEVRYAVRLADFREPLDFRTHPAPPDLRWQIRVCAFFQTPPQVVCVRWGFVLGASDDYPFEQCVVLGFGHFLAFVLALQPPDPTLLWVFGGFLR